MFITFSLESSRIKTIVYEKTKTRILSNQDLAKKKKKTHSIERNWSVMNSNTKLNYYQNKIPGQVIYYVGHSA